MNIVKDTIKKANAKSVNPFIKYSLLIALPFIVVGTILLFSTLYLGIVLVLGSACAFDFAYNKFRKNMLKKEEMNLKLKDLNKKGIDLQENLENYLFFKSIKTYMALKESQIAYNNEIDTVLAVKNKQQLRLVKHFGKTNPERLKKVHLVHDESAEAEIKVIQDLQSKLNVYRSTVDEKDQLADPLINKLEEVIYNKLVFSKIPTFYFPNKVTGDDLRQIETAKYSTLKPLVSTRENTNTPATSQPEQTEACSLHM